MDYFNKALKQTTTVIGVLLALSGILNHGIFEVLQGNTPTNAFFINAIGAEHQFWSYGGELAFTLVHNFLITGILVILIGMTLMVWSLKFIHIPHASSVFLLLIVLMTLSGGGLAHILIFLPAWAFSTRIRTGLSWWKRILPDRMISGLSKLWPFALSLTAFAWLLIMELGIFGIFPGLSDPDMIMNIVLLDLLFSAILVVFSYICSIGRDLQSQKESA